MMNLDDHAAALLGHARKNPARWRRDAEGLWLQQAREPRDVDLRDTDAYGHDVSGSVFTRVDATGMNLDFTSLSEAEITDCNFRDASLIGSYGYFIQGQHTSFEGANFAGAQYYESPLMGDLEPERSYLEGMFWNDDMTPLPDTFLLPKARKQVRILRGGRPPGDASGGTWLRLRYTDPEEAGERGADTLAQHALRSSVLHAGSLIALQESLHDRRRMLEPSDRALDVFSARLQTRLLDNHGNLRVEVLDEADEDVPNAEWLLHPYMLVRRKGRTLLTRGETPLAWLVGTDGLDWGITPVAVRDAAQTRWDTYVHLHHAVIEPPIRSADVLRFLRGAPTPVDRGP